MPHSIAEGQPAKAARASCAGPIETRCSPSVRPQPSRPRGAVFRMARRPRERQFGSRHAASSKLAHQRRAAKTWTQRRAIETSRGPDRIQGRPARHTGRRTWPAVRMARGHTAQVRHTGRRD